MNKNKNIITRGSQHSSNDVYVYNVTLFMIIKYTYDNIITTTEIMNNLSVCLSRYPLIYILSQTQYNINVL